CNETGTEIDCLIGRACAAIMQVHDDDGAPDLDYLLIRTDSTKSICRGDCQTKPAGSGKRPSTVSTGFSARRRPRTQPDTKGLDSGSLPVAQVSDYGRARLARHR